MRGTGAVNSTENRRACLFYVLVLLLLLCVISPLAACGQDVVSDNAASNASGAPGSNPTPHPTPEAASAPPPVYTYEVVNRWPHDSKAFTQGLAFHDGVLYESTGHYGSSTLRRVELRTGKVSKKIPVHAQYFAEGMTIFRQKIYQLTWTAHKGFIYDLKSLRLEGEFPVEGEGWGLANDGELLIQSDGTNRIRFLDPATYRTVRDIKVMDGGKPLMELNELEYVKGEIYANIWKSERIVRIDPQTGRILGWIDLTGLFPQDERDNPEEDVLNGIAYDEKEDRLFVTGKRWPRLFEIRVRKKEPGR